MLNSSMNLKISVFLNTFFCLFLCMTHTCLCLIWDNDILSNDEKVHVTTIKASQIWIMCIWIYQQIVLKGSMNLTFWKMTVFLNMFFSFSLFALLFLSSCHGLCHSGECGEKDCVTTWKQTVLTCVKREHDLFFILENHCISKHVIFCFFLCMTLSN